MDIEGQILTIPRSWLVGEWLLDGNALDTNDWTKNSGTATNVTYANTTIGYQKQYGIFNWSSSWVSAWNVLDETWASAFSLSCWVNFSSVWVNQMIFGKQLSSGSFGGYMIWGQFLTTPNRFRLNMSLVANDSSFADIEVITPDNELTTWVWYHIVATYDWSKTAAGTKIYIDKVLKSSTSLDWLWTKSISTTANFTIWTRSTWNLPVNGNIQCARKYNYVLSSRDIEALYLEWKRKLWNAWYPDLFNGCVAYYDFKGDANDVVGWINMTATNATLTSDRFWIANSAYSFNWSSAYLTTSAVVTTGTSATFSFWLYKTNDNDQCFFIEEAYSNNSMLFFDAATRKINYRFGATNMISTAANPVTNNTWNYISVTHTWTTWTIYINGVQAAQWTVNAKTGSGTALTLGRLTATLYFFNGYMSDFKVMSVAMSADQVKAEYQASLKSKIYPFTRSLPLNLRNGLVLHLDGTVSGTTAYDQSGNGNNLTLANTPTKIRVWQLWGWSFNWSNQQASVASNLWIDWWSVRMSAFVKMNAEIWSSIQAFITCSSTTSQVANAILYDYNGWTRRLIFYRSKQWVADEQLYYNITLGTSKYYYLVYDYDWTTIRWYINGTLIWSASASWIWTWSAYPSKTVVWAYHWDNLFANANIILPKIYNTSLNWIMNQQDFHTSYIQ